MFTVARKRAFLGLSGTIGLSVLMAFFSLLLPPAASQAEAGSVVALPRPVNTLNEPPISGDDALSLLSGMGSLRLFGGNPSAPGITAAPSLAGPAPSFPGVGPNVVVNNKANDSLTVFTQSETSVAVFGQNVVVGYNDFAGPTALSGYSFSSNGGTSFTQGSNLFTVGGASGDPSLAVDSVGVFYYAFLDTGTVAGVSQSGITVAVSTNGGQSFPNGSFFASGLTAGAACDFIDKEHIDVLASSSPGPARIVVSYTRFINGKSKTAPCGAVVTANIEAIVVDPNAGTVIQGPVVLGTGSGSIPRVDGTGRIFVAWANTGTNQIQLRRSDDGGALYTALDGVGAPVVVSGVTPIGFNSTAGQCDAGTTAVRRLLNGNFRVNFFPTMGIDRSGGIGNGNVYIAWNDGGSGDADISFARSINTGGVWSAPIRVNDDGVSNGRDQFYPWLTVDSNGQIGIIFMDRRNDANNSLIDVFHSESVNRGLNFNTNGRVTDVSFPPVVNVEAGVALCYMGDYNGAASDANHIYAAWGDNRDGEPDAMFAVLHNAQDVRVQGTLEFGLVAVNPVGGEDGTKDLEFEVLNVGSQNLTVNSVTCASGNCSEFTVNPNPTTPLVISPDAHVSFVVRFNPAFAGPRSATIRVSTDDPDQPTNDLTANGTGAVPDITVSGSTDFGDVCAGTLAEKVVSVCNLGQSNLSVTAALTGCTQFTLVNPPSFPAIVSHDFCFPVTIRFTPTTAGPQSCNLVITSNDPDTPTVTKTVTASTPVASIDVPPNQSFLPEVIQTAGVCTTAKPFPISNTGTCNLNITNIAIGGVNGGDYSLSGLPSFPIILQPGHVAGEGNLKTVFAPTAIDRDRLGSLSVTYSNPITNALTTVNSDLCGEGVRTGARVLVRNGGVPLTTVEKIQLQRINANRNKSVLDTNDVVQNATLQTVTPAATCLLPLPPIQFHREYGTVGNPIQLLAGSYQVTASAIINGKHKSKTVGFNVDTCDFNPTVIIDF
jgi:hypothetical protein